MQKEHFVELNDACIVTCDHLDEADISRSKPLGGTIQGNYSTNEIHFLNATLSWKF